MARLSAVLLVLAVTACVVSSRPSSAGIPAASAPTSGSPGSPFAELRARPLRLAALPLGHGCPNTPDAGINLNGNQVLAHGTGPFYFGPYGPDLGAGDFNKTPWSVASAYDGRLVVRGRRLNGSGTVSFGFWPGPGARPAAQPDLPVLFRREDAEGRPFVYQAELDIDVGPANWGAWRVGGNF